LGFGKNPHEAAQNAIASLHDGFNHIKNEYFAGWHIGRSHSSRQKGASFSKDLLPKVLPFCARMSLSRNEPDIQRRAPAARARVYGGVGSAVRVAEDADDHAQDGTTNLALHKVPSNGIKHGWTGSPAFRPGLSRR